MEDLNRMQHLLNNVSIISKKYEDIAKITGENFNIFSVIRMETDERYTHSAIIGELLNPKGSHGQGSVFLKLFFKEIAVLNEIENFDYDNTQVILEEFIGRKNDNSNFSGFIDIVLKEKNNIIVIENKIYAGDQDEQLKRYKNYYPNCTLLYLNLFGSAPNKESTIDLEFEKDFQIITYFHNIKNWLDKCHKVSVDQPILRESIKQYLNIVKKLTNQTINDTMSEEINSLMTNKTKESFEIVNNIAKLKETLYLNFMNLIIDFAKLNQISVNETDINKSKIEYGLYLKPGLWVDKNINICIIFENSNYRGFYYGVSYEPELNEIDKSEIREKFKSNGFQDSDYWIWKYSQDMDWVENGEIWDEVSKGINGRIYKEIIDGINKIIEIEKSS